MAKQIIHVAQQAIQKNRRDGTDEPAIIIRTGSKSQRVHELDLVVDGKVIGQMVYRPNDPLSCGARLWLELDTDICQAVPKEKKDAELSHIL